MLISKSKEVGNSIVNLIVDFYWVRKISLQIKSSNCETKLKSWICVLSDFFHLFVFVLYGNTGWANKRIKRQLQSNVY